MNEICFFIVLWLLELFFMGQVLIILRPLYMYTGISQLNEWMVGARLLTVEGEVIDKKGEEAGVIMREQVIVGDISIKSYLA